MTVRRMNFAQLDQVAPGVKFDFVLADLGVSSMQIDNPERASPLSRTDLWTSAWTPLPASPLPSA